MKPFKLVRNTALAATSLFLFSYSMLGYSSDADYTATIKITNQLKHDLNFVEMIVLYQRKN